MKKLLVIAGQDIALRVVDPIALLLAIGVPVVIAALLNVAFGGIVLGRGIPETEVEVGIVNLDQGSQWGRFGEIFVRAMIPSLEEGRPGHGSRAQSAQLVWDDLTQETARLNLFAAREIESEEKARHMVDREQLIAALIVPTDFSERLTAGGDRTPAAAVDVYINGRESILGAAFSCLAETLANGMASGEVTIRTAVNGLLEDPRARTRLRSGDLDQAIADVALQAALPRHYPVRVQRDPAAQGAAVVLTHRLGAAIAIMGLGFTALIVSAALYQEKANWTLQRVTITPTRVWIVIGGKTLGTYALGFMQMVVLIASMATIERVLGSGPYSANTDPWKGPVPGLSLLLLVMTATAAATGLGVAITALTRTYSEAANYGRAALVLMGLVGGIFFSVELFPRPFDLVSRLTFHYWALAGYEQWASGGGLTGVLPHAVVLAAMGGLLFAFGSSLLRRRIGFW